MTKSSSSPSSRKQRPSQPSPAASSHHQPTLTREIILQHARMSKPVAQYGPSRLSETHAKLSKPPPALEGPLLPTDVLFGRGTLVAQSPGNKLMRLGVSLNQDLYRQSSSDEKRFLADALVAFFESHGTRFVERMDKSTASANDGTKKKKKMKQTDDVQKQKPQNKIPGTHPTSDTQRYQYVSYGRVLEKFMQALREKIVYSNTGLQPSQQMLQFMTRPPTHAWVRDTRGNGGGRRKRKINTEEDAPDTSGKKKRGCPSKEPNDEAHSYKARVSALASKVQQAATLRSQTHFTTVEMKKLAAMGMALPMTTEKYWMTVRKGDRLAVYWDGDDLFYPCTILLKRSMDLMAKNPSILVSIVYDEDQQEETIDLRSTPFYRLLHFEPAAGTAAKQRKETKATKLPRKKLKGVGQTEKKKKKAPFTPTPNTTLKTTANTVSPVSSFASDGLRKRLLPPAAMPYSSSSSSSSYDDDDDANDEESAVTVTIQGTFARSKAAPWGSSLTSFLRRQQQKKAQREKY